MTTETAPLFIDPKGRHFVTLPSKKGTANIAIPMGAVFYNKAEANSGDQTNVELGPNRKVLKVTIIGQPVVQPKAPAADTTRQRGRGDSGKGNRGRSGRDRNTHQPQQRNHSKIEKADASVIGLPFNNPYSFIPFPSEAPTRGEFSRQTVDELSDETQRYTGIIKLKVTTNSPLLTSAPQSIERNGNNVHKILSIGNDVIVPATSIRGMLRSLASIITGGTLTNMNPNEFLCEGRDLNLGPRGKKSPPNTPDNVFLAEVVTAGTDFRDGTIRLGETKLLKAESIEQALKGERLSRPDNNGKQKPLWAAIDSNNRITAIGKSSSDSTKWKIKLSGQPIGRKPKREGAFLPNGPVITAPSYLWGEYSSRNRHGVRPELKKGDLIWIEHVDPKAGTDSVRSADDIASLQWARWGKSGDRLINLLPHDSFISDRYQVDGKVDEITNMFGQVGMEPENQHVTFGGRLRPDNLVFDNGTEQIIPDVTLAPLSSPHVACSAFYRKTESADSVSPKDKLKGYKVYRNSREHGKTAPWLYQTQGIYDEGGKPKDPKSQKMVQTVDLLQANTTGSLQITFHAFTQRELAILVQCCCLPWKIGGGKPLGLGATTVQIVSLLDETGQPLQVSEWEIVEDGESLRIDGFQKAIDDIIPRAQIWKRLQEPVDTLRYPRAVSTNNNRKQRGGHEWFKRHALRRKGNQDSTPKKGLQSLHIGGDLLQNAIDAGKTLDKSEPLIAGQILPPFDSNNPTSDLLFGFDGIDVNTRHPQRGERGEAIYNDIQPFHPKTHITGSEKSGGNTSQNQESRQKRRDERGSQPG